MMLLRYATKSFSSAIQIEQILIGIFNAIDFLYNCISTVPNAGSLFSGALLPHNLRLLQARPKRIILAERARGRTSSKLPNVNRTNNQREISATDPHDSHLTYFNLLFSTRMGLIGQQTGQDRRSQLQSDSQWQRESSNRRSRGVLRR